VGTEIQAEPTAAAAGANNHVFHPPFNRICTYREPGRINLNTIYSEDVWKGLMNYFPDNNSASAGWQWAKFLQSRQGYAGGSILAIDQAYPTQFARPFRSFGGRILTLPFMQTDRESESSLLRSDAAALTLSTNQPLFQSDATTVIPTPTNANDPDRNPFFRYQALERLGNLVTTRSNVYAVWITVGYFEVEPAPAPYNPQVYPDGYRLSRELGSDTGEIDRHRAFYIFDRTLPVGFQRGQDLNVEKAILLKRFIE
jgi:hypothetical protein